MDGGRFIAAMRGAVGALGIVMVTVVSPFSFFHEFLKGLRVPVIQQIAGFLPTQHGVIGIAPGRAIIIAFAA